MRKARSFALNCALLGLPIIGLLPPTPAEAGVSQWIAKWRGKKQAQQGPAKTTAPARAATPEPTLEERIAHSIQAADVRAEEVQRLAAAHEARESARRVALEQTLGTMVGRPMTHAAHVAVLDANDYDGYTLTLEGRADPKDGVVRTAVVLHTRYPNKQEELDVKPNGQGLDHALLEKYVKLDHARVVKSFGRTANGAAHDVAGAIKAADEREGAAIAAEHKVREGLATTLSAMVGKPVRFAGPVVTLVGGYYGDTLLALEARADESGAIKTAVVYRGGDHRNDPRVIRDFDPKGEDMSFLRKQLGIDAKTIHDALAR